MALPNIFSRRLRQQQSAGNPDVYEYDQLPKRLRVQITHVWDETFGLHNVDNDRGMGVVKEMVAFLRKEIGTYHLTGSDYQDKREELYNWFLNEPDVTRCFDAVEMGFLMIDRIVRANQYRFQSKSPPDDAIAELNARLLEARVGYQYEGGALVRIDSQLLHSEVVKPVIALLREARYAAVNAEFLEAHRLYRAGDFEKCLTECCKAFESTLKVILAKRSWPVAPNAPAKTLLDAVFANGLVPEYLQGGIGSLRALLEGSIPTVRNRTSGHGAGTARRTVSRHLAAFQMHQTAAAILFLIQAEKALQ